MKELIEFIEMQQHGIAMDAKLLGRFVDIAETGKVGFKGRCVIIKSAAFRQCLITFKDGMQILE